MKESEIGPVLGLFIILISFMFPPLGLILFFMIKED